MEESENPAPETPRALPATGVRIKTAVCRCQFDGRSSAWLDVALTQERFLQITAKSRFNSGPAHFFVAYTCLWG